MQRLLSIGIDICRSVLELRRLVLFTLDPLSASLNLNKNLPISLMTQFSRANFLITIHCLWNVLVGLSFRDVVDGVFRQIPYLLFANEGVYH